LRGHQQGRRGRSGDHINYTFTVKNTGNVTLHNVVLSDTVGGVSIGPLSDPAGNGSDVLAVGETETALGRYRFPQGDTHAAFKDNPPLVTGKGPQDQPVSVTDSHHDPLAQTPSLDLVNAGAYEDTNKDGVVDLGDHINYTFTVKNTG